MKKKLVILLLLGMFLAGCKDLNATPAGAEGTDTVVNDGTADEAAPAETQNVVPTPLPIDPYNLKFMTSDEVELFGEFWAPTYKNTPVVVLMHQYQMDHNIEWIALAPWLQNRGLAQYVSVGGEPWSNPRWFAPTIEGVEYAVFTFTFRNCLGGCREDSVESRSEWILDAVTAIETAASFKSVDPTRVIVVGTSIGADAAVDACAQFIDHERIKCIGAVSLSPGSYLDVPYAEAVAKLTEAGVSVKCVAAEGDTLSAETCAGIEAEGYEAIITSGSSHGIRLFDPSLEIDLTKLLQGWMLEWTFNK